MPEVSEVRTASSIVAMTAAEPSAYVRGQYRGYLDIDGVAPGSQTEPARAQDQAAPHDELVRAHGGWHEPWMPT
jgi:hypothetical protein